MNKVRGTGIESLIETDPPTPDQTPAPILKLKPEKLAMLAEERAQRESIILKGRDAMIEYVEGIAELNKLGHGSPELTLSMRSAQESLFWMKADGHDGIWKE